MLNLKLIALVFVLITIALSSGIRLGPYKMAGAEGAPSPPAQPMPVGAPAPGAGPPNSAGPPAGGPPNPAAAISQAVACTGPDCPLRFATVNQAGGGSPALPTAMPR